MDDDNENDVDDDDNENDDNFKLWLLRDQLCNS